jgi:Protein of unknown function (DUF3071)
MRDLKPVGLSEDGHKLVLVSDSGEKYAVPADGRLRAALRGDRARLGQLEIEMDSALRPRDIQARIRAGETTEAVAAVAGVDMDRVLGYAVPVLAERSHIAERAQRSALRRKGGEGPGRLLGDAVAERLRGRGVDPASADWDAWRRDDGRWTVQVSYEWGEHHRVGMFQYDAPGRYVLPDDDEGRWLVGDPPASDGPHGHEPSQTRRLAAVRDDTIGMLSLADTESTIDLTDDGSGPRSVEAPDDMSALADAIREQPDPPQVAAAGGYAGTPDTAPPQGESSTSKPDRRSTRKSRRAVPSWDEIMFGKSD